MKKLLIALIAGMLMIVPAMAMDTISDSDLDGISGQAGVTIGFGGTQITEVEFSAVAWGDPDGLGGSTTAGYVRIEGTIGITISIAQGETLAIDVATDAAGTTINSVVIPAGTFIALALPDQDITVTVPSTFTIGLGAASTAIDGTIGELTLEGLTVTVTQASNLYIWAH